MGYFIGFCVEGLPFDGNTIHERALGGSESAAYYVARELARLGHTVKVFCNCDVPGGVYDGVDYMPLEQLEHFKAYCEWDVFIISRNPVRCSSNYPAKLRILWNHDVPPTEQMLMCNAWQLDALFVLSEYQKQLYVDRAKHLEKIIWTTRNGVDVDAVNHAIKSGNITRQDNQFIYTSRPERGLDILLGRIWPRFVEKHPDARLNVCYYDYTIPGVPQQTQEIQSQCAAMIKADPTVTMLGHLKKADLFRAIGRCKAVLYPSIFCEISCISAMESMACGTPMIATNEFAIKETLPQDIGGYLVDGNPYSEEYADAYLEAMERLYDNTEYKRLSQSAQVYAQEHYRWDMLAKTWTKFFDTAFATRAQHDPSGVVNALLKQGDRRGALVTAGRLGLDKASVDDIESGIDECKSAGYKTAPPSGPITRIRPALPVRSACDIVPEDSAPDTTVAVLGCGSGGLAGFLVQKCPNVIVYATDQNQEILDWACENIPTILEESQSSRIVFLDWTEFRDANTANAVGFDYVIACHGYLECADSIKGALSKLQSLAKVDAPIAVLSALGDWSHAENAGEIGAHSFINRLDFLDMQAVMSEHREVTVEPVPTSASIHGNIIGSLVTKFKATGRPFHSPDFSRRLMVRPYQRIYGCMIGQNEETNVLGSIKSMLPICDEFVFVDGGSKDQTVKLVREAFPTVTIIQHPFDNFADQRNVSIQNAKPEDWVLWIDCDEILANPHNIRKYLHTSVFEGYVIRQNHFALDVPNKEPDFPVRLHKHRPHYKFVGYVHEHIENTANGPYDNPLDPLLVISDADIAHTGYLQESIRRNKLSERNLDLLRRERVDHPDRQFGSALVMRDYVNLSEWRMQEWRLKHRARGAIPRELVIWLRATCMIYHDPDYGFSAENHQYHKFVYQYYQRALLLLGTLGIPAAEDLQNPPFEIELGLRAGVGGLDPNSNVAPDKIWFATHDECAQFLGRSARSLMEGLGGNADTGETGQGRRKALEQAFG